MPCVIVEHSIIATVEDFSAGFDATYPGVPFSTFLRVEVRNFMIMLVVKTSAELISPETKWVRTIHTALFFINSHRRDHRIVSSPFSLHNFLLFCLLSQLQFFLILELREL